MINHKIFATPELVVENLANEMKATASRVELLPGYFTVRWQHAKNAFKLLVKVTYAGCIQWNNLHFGVKRRTLQVHLMMLKVISVK